MATLVDKREEKIAIKFEYLGFGRGFVHDNRIFMKIDECSIGDAKANSVDNDGILYFFGPQKEVTEIKLEGIIWDIYI